MRWLFAVSASAVMFLTVALGTLVPLQRPDGIEYLFVQPHTTPLAVAAALAVAAIALLYIGLIRLTKSTASALAMARSGRWLAPGCLAGAVVLGVIPAVPHVGEHGSVVGYFFYDLRWWWLVLPSALVLGGAGRVLSTAGVVPLAAIPGWGPVARARALELLVCAGAMAIAIAATPHLRFSGMLHGDEPRYIRYCELWYEGGGLDVSRVSLVGDTPTLRPRLLGNLTHLVDAIRIDSGALLHDVAAASRHPFTFKWNRATAEDAFVHGIHGGLYQVHQPGVSVALFPGYVIDRYLLTEGAASDGKFPAALPMTNLMMLLTYGVAAVALFRLLRSALKSDAWALASAAVGILLLPASAFAFQFYPELPVLVIVLMVTRYLWFTTSTRTVSAAIAGAAAGSMAWFHPRFLLLGLVFVGVAALRRSGRMRIAFLTGFAALLFSLMAYDYHVTGSWLPTALWDATGEGVHFLDTSIVWNFVGYGIDRTWGVLPHALILIAALPGLVVLGRQSIGQATFVGGMTAALTLTAAGHTLSAAGTTPDRLIVAVVPLLMWPTALLVRQIWYSPPARATVTILTVMALDAALSYNLHHEKPFGAMRDASAIGWKPNLAFPVMRGDIWSSSSANFHLFLGVGIAIGVISILAWYMATRPRQSRVDRSRIWLNTSVVIVAFLVMFSTATSVNGDWTSRAYLLDRDAARLTAAHALVDVDRCLACMSTSRANVDWTTLEPNSARGAALSIDREHRAIHAHVHVDGDGESLAFGRLRLDFGDGSGTSWTGIVTDKTVDHTYRTDGVFRVTLFFKLRTGEIAIAHQNVDVRANN